MRTSRPTRQLLPLVLWMVVAWNGAGMQGIGAEAPLAAQAPTTPEAQIEKGRAAVSQVCIGCHANIMGMLQTRQKPEEEWRDTVYSMIGRGAQVLPDEIEPLTAYLTATAGRGRPEPAAAPGDADTPTAAANAILAQSCARCHDLVRATTPPASGDWQTVIDRMVTLGASVTPAEQQTLIDYLTGLER